MIDAIRQGAEKTGAAFDYLLSTAQRESSLNPSAKAGSSSATGLFQFIEQTWLGVMKQDGPSLGLGSYADAITARRRAATPSATRPPGSDPRPAAGSRDRLRDGRGTHPAQRRRPVRGARPRTEPGRPLRRPSPRGTRGPDPDPRRRGRPRPHRRRRPAEAAAAGNRGLFYDRAGRARSASELYAVLGTSPAVPTTANTTLAAQAAAPSAYAPEAGSGLRSLFQTDARRGPVSDSVARLWGSRSNGASAPSYFPRSGDGPILAFASPAPSPPAVPAAIQDGTQDTLQDAPAAGVPLPPARPREFGGRGRAALTPPRSNPDHPPRNPSTEPRR